MLFGRGLRQVVTMAGARKSLPLSKTGVRFFSRTMPGESNLQKYLQQKPGLRLCANLPPVAKILEQAGVSLVSPASHAGVTVFDETKARWRATKDIFALTGVSQPSCENLIEQANAYWQSMGGVSTILKKLSARYGELTFDEYGIIDVAQLPLEQHAPNLSRHVLALFQSFLGNKFQSRSYESTLPGAPTEWEHALQSMGLMTLYTSVATDIDTLLTHIVGSFTHDAGRWITSDQQLRCIGRGSLGSQMLKPFGPQVSLTAKMHVVGKHLLHEGGYFPGESLPRDPRYLLSVRIALNKLFLDIPDDKKIGIAAEAMAFYALIDDVAKAPVTLCPDLLSISQADVMRLLSWQLYLRQHQLLAQNGQARAVESFTYDCACLFANVQGGRYDRVNAGIVIDGDIMALLHAIDYTMFFEHDWPAKLANNLSSYNDRMASSPRCGL